jgi:hypothetical protein
MAWSQTDSGFGAGANAASTGSMNLTGATILIAHVGYYSASALVGSDLSDSSSNTWVALTAHDQNGDTSIKGQFFYVIAPSVSGAQTVTVTKATTYMGLTVIGLQGFTATFSSESARTTYAVPVTSVQAPSIGSAGDLVIAGTNWDGSKTSVSAIDSSFSAVIEQAYGGGNNEGSAIAWKEVSGAVQPTWSWTGTTSNGLAHNINFTSSGGGGGTRPVKMVGPWGGFAGSSGGFAG